MGCGSTKPKLEMVKEESITRSSVFIKDTSALIPLILGAYAEFTDNKEEENEGNDPRFWIRQYSGDVSVRKNQVLMFLKPEVMAKREGVKLEQVLFTVLHCLAIHKVDIGAIRMIPGAYIKKHKIIEAHYGVINKISTEGKAALSAQATTKLEEIYSEELKNGAVVLGAHQFLQRMQEEGKSSTVHAFSLQVMHSQAECKKLGPGAYGTHLTLADMSLIVLNAFHPQQIHPYNNPSNAILVIEGRTDSQWSYLRQNLCGATDPEKAVDGSLRKQFFERKEELGISEIDSTRNGIHMSAGPLEALKEFRLFLNNPDEGELAFDHTRMGGSLSVRGANKKQVMAWLNNVPVRMEDGRELNTFDLTEETDTPDAVDLLLSSSPCVEPTSSL